MSAVYSRRFLRSGKPSRLSQIVSCLICAAIAVGVVYLGFVLESM